FHTVGPYTPRGEPIDWLAEQYKCWISQPVTFALLACLQAVNLFWLALIAKIAWRFVVTKAVDDERSEYEEEEEDEAEGEEKNVKALETEREEGEVKKGAPQVLLNGEPVEVGASPGLERRRRKGQR
ncbi:sphingosine N-acyltransferase lag1, partial [Cryomyces antarcticus]